jgi:hypothetical protein
MLQFCLAMLQFSLAIQLLPIEKQEGTEGLILGRSGNLLLDIEMSKESFDPLRIHLLWVLLVVEKNIEPDPIDVTILQYRNQGVTI